MLLLTLLLALILDALLGDPPTRFHPVGLMGKFIRRAVEHAPAGNPAAESLYGGAVLLAGILLFSLPLAVLPLIVPLESAPGLVIHAVLLKCAFSMRRLLEAGAEVQTALEQNDLPEARRRVGWHLVSRDTHTLSEGHVASAAIESLAENLADSFIAPLLAFAVGGLPLAWAYRFVNTADAMIGYRTPRYEYLGKCAARLDDLLNWLPSRLSGWLIVLGAPLAQGDRQRAGRIMLAQHNRTASPNAGWPMSAAAGALGIVLEKINHYRLEGGRQLPEPRLIQQTRRLVLAAASLGVVLIAGLIGARLALDRLSIG